MLYSDFMGTMNFYDARTIDDMIAQIRIDIGTGSGQPGESGGASTTEVERIDGEVSRLKTDVANTKADVLNKLDKNDTGYTGLQQRVTALEAAGSPGGTPAPNGKLDELDRAVKQVQTEVADHSERLMNIDDESNGALTHIRSELSDYKSRIEVLESTGEGGAPSGTEYIKATTYMKYFAGQVEDHRAGANHGKFWWNPGGGNKADGQWRYLFGTLHLRLAIHFSPSWFDEPNFTTAQFRTKVTTEILRDKITYKNADEQNPGQGLDYYLRGVQAFGGRDYDNHTALQGIAWPMSSEAGKPSAQRGTPCRVDIGPDTLHIHADRNQMNEVDWRAGMYVLVSGMV